MDLHPLAPARLRPCPRLAALAAAALASASLGVPATAQDNRTTSAQASVSDGRPILAISSAERFASVMPDPSNPDVQSVLAGVGASQLEFFDDLERQTLVCHDDALHACLLLGAGINATSFQQRTEMAARLGWIAPTFDRPGREAATLGEVCRMLARMMGKPESITQDESLAFVSGLRVLPSEVSDSAASGTGTGVLPSQLKPYQGLTGSQLITILGSVHDAIAPRGHDAVSMAQPREIVAAAPIVVQPAAQPVQPASPVDQVIAEVTGEPVPVAPVKSQVVVAPALPAHAATATAPVASQPTRIEPTRIEPTRIEPTRIEHTHLEPPPVVSVSTEPVVPAAPEPVIEPVAPSDLPSEPAAAPVIESPSDPARFSQFRHGKPVKRPTTR